MLEIQNSIIASASRNRTNLASNRNEIAQRESREKLSFNAFDAARRRKEITDEAVVRSERAIQLRRNDLEHDLENARARAEQNRFADTVASDAAFQNRQAAIASELIDQRADRAAVYDLTLSEFDESLALDQIAPGGSADPATRDTDSASNFKTFLAERDDRIADRALSQRDHGIQQQIDLRLAGDNLRSGAQGAELPRGSLVDVLG